MFSSKSNPTNPTRLQADRSGGRTHQARKVKEAKLGRQPRESIPATTQSPHSFLAHSSRTGHNAVPSNREQRQPAPVVPEQGTTVLERKMCSTLSIFSKVRSSFRRFDTVTRNNAQACKEMGELIGSCYIDVTGVVGVREGSVAGCRGEAGREPCPSRFRVAVQTAALSRQEGPRATGSPGQGIPDRYRGVRQAGRFRPAARFLCSRSSRAPENETRRVLRLGRRG